MNASLIFLVIVILVTATLVYLYFNKMGPWKKEKSPAPAPAPAPAQTQVLPKITDFSVDRTLSPDGSSEPYTIEPYTIEPYTTEDILALSKNVTFTLKWTNGIGFTEAGVNKIEVYHGVMSGTTFNNASDWELRKTIEANSTDDPPLGLNNFETVSVEISGNGAYSFEGINFFKIVAYYGTSSDIQLYNSYTLWGPETDETKKNSYGIVISNDEIVGTTDLLTPETITYEPRLDSSKGQTLFKEITNQRYDFYYFKNVPSSTDTQGELLFENVRLVPVDSSGTQFKLEKDDKYFSIINSETKEYSFDASKSSDASIVYIAESRETDDKVYDEVIMLKVLIGGEPYYLFGPDMGFKKINDQSISNADKFFRRNIYIKQSQSNV